MTETTPAWKRERIEEKAARISRTTQPRTCHHCAATVLTGLNSDVMAETVTVDPVALTPLGEAYAVLSGHETYTLTQRAGRLELDYRHDWDRDDQPLPRSDVVPQHSCGGVWPDQVRAVSRLPAPVGDGSLF